MSLAVLETRLSEWIEQGEFLGTVVTLADRDQIFYNRAFGLAKVTPVGEAMAIDHRFLLTSITKTLLSTQIMRLVEQGKLALDVPVARYLPEFAINGKEAVTTWHLLTHTSGMSQSANTAERRSEGMSPADHLQVALTAPLTFPPGERFEYCSPPFWILAELINRFAGREYTADFVESVARPCGMTSTRYEIGPIADRLVPAQGAADWQVPEQQRRLAYPSGGVVATASDLARFGQCLLNRGQTPLGERLLSPASVVVMTTPQTVGLPGQPFGELRGLGFAIGGPGTLRSPRTFGHRGASGTFYFVDPDRALVAVFLTAQWNLDPRIFSSFSDIVIGGLDY